MVAISVFVLRASNDSEGRAKTPVCKTRAKRRVDQEIIPRGQSWSLIKEHSVSRVAALKICT